MSSINKASILDTFVSKAQDVGQFNVAIRRSGPGPLGNLSGRAFSLETSALKPWALLIEYTPPIPSMALVYLPT